MYGSAVNAAKIVDVIIHQVLDTTFDREEDADMRVHGRGMMILQRQQS